MKMNEVVSEPKIWNFPGVPVSLGKVLGSLSSTCAFHLSAFPGVALPSPGVSLLGIGGFFKKFAVFRPADVWFFPISFSSAV